MARSVSRLAAEVTGERRGAALSCDLIFLWLWQLKSWMHVFAVGSIGAEAGKVVHAEDSSDVPIAAERSQSAESAVVPRTVLQTRVRTDVQEWTFFVVTSICRTKLLLLS